MMALMTEIVFSGFISKVVNDIVDISKDKIIKAVKNRKVKNQNLESQIYNITIDVLNDITDNMYKNNQDNIYDAAEILLKSFKYDKGNELENIKSCLQIIYINVDENKCMVFKRLFYEEIGKDEYSELYRAILLLLLEQKNQYAHAVNEQLYQKLIKIEQKIDKLNQKLDEKKEDNENSIAQDTSVKIKNDKKQDYVENWNSRMFLHQDNDEKPVTLANAFITPDYKVYKSLKQMNFSDDDVLDDIIEKFMEYDRTLTMLITGVPGIGKTTITSWLANKYKENNNVIILRFRDWESDELEDGVLKAIYNTLELKKKDLENKILVLDGFDEMKSLDIRDKLLSNFFNDIKDYKNFKCIITSRPTYIQEKHFHVTLELEEFDIDKIERFFEKITGEKLKNKEKIESNREVLGIPVILYMAIMSNVDISENPTKPELYNRIFSEEGGIFDRFYDGKNEYSKGAQILRNSDNIKIYLKFLQDIAFNMYVKKRLSLDKNEYNIPELMFQGNMISVLEFPIKHLFENTKANIEFIHNSIYEYFVADYIIKKINEAIYTNISKEDFASILGDILIIKNLSLEIMEFLKYKISTNEKINDFDKISTIFQIMLQDGVTYYIKKHLHNVIEQEMLIFHNMLNFIHLWDEDCYNLGVDIDKYLRHTRESELNLSKVNLNNTNLRIAVLIEANLQKANLQEADLTGANLRGADLRGADLRGTILDITTLTDAIFDESQVEYLEEKCDLRGIKIINSETGSVISYKEYSRIKYKRRKE